MMDDRNNTPVLLYPCPRPVSLRSHDDGSHQQLYLFQNLFVFFPRFYLKFTGFEGGNIATDLIFKCCSNITILAQEVFSVFATLTQADIANVEPCAALLDETHL